MIRMTIKMSNMDVTFMYNDVWKREDPKSLFTGTGKLFRYVGGDVACERSIDGETGKSWKNLAWFLREREEFCLD